MLQPPPDPRAHLPESDWRLLRTVHDAALERYCAAVLAECEAEIRRDASAHERYQRLFRLIETRDRNIAAAFNDLRRSTAMLRLGSMIALDAVTDAELAQFTPSTRERVAIFASPPALKRPGRR